MGIYNGIIRNQEKEIEFYHFIAINFSDCLPHWDKGLIGGICGKDCVREDWFE